MITKQFGLGILIGIMITFPICVYTLDHFYRACLKAAISEIHRQYKEEG